MQKCLIVTGCDWRCVDVYDDIGALNASFKELFFSNVIFVPSGSFSRAIFLPSPAVQSSIDRWHRRRTGRRQSGIKRKREFC